MARSGRVPHPLSQPSRPAKPAVGPNRILCPHPPRVGRCRWPEKKPPRIVTRLSSSWGSIAGVNPNLYLYSNLTNFNFWVIFLDYSPVAHQYQRSTGHGGLFIALHQLVCDFAHVQGSPQHTMTRFLRQCTKTICHSKGVSTMFGHLPRQDIPTNPPLQGGRFISAIHFKVESLLHRSIGPILENLSTFLVDPPFQRG